MEVIGVRFLYTKRIHYYSFNGFECNKGMSVICESDYGTCLGNVVTNIIDIDPSKMNYEITSITRLATNDDIEKNNKNILDASNALEKCKELIKKHNLDMHAINALYTFDRDQLIIFFVADSRVDFRELARELASIGGIGICGGELCCARFLKEFDSVSINMAKNQNIALNPTKINGVCGRLLCCLKYEDDVYSSKRKGLPNVGKSYETEKGVGKVISVDVLSRTIKVEVGSSIIEVNLDENN